MLKQKYMETKTKRNAKKNDKKPMENGNNAMPPVSFSNVLNTNYNQVCVCVSGMSMVPEYLLYKRVW